MRIRKPALSLYGHLIFLGLIVVGSTLAREAEILLLAPVALLWIWAVGGGPLKRLRQPRLWLFILSIVVVSTLAWGEEGEGVIFLGLSLSRQGLLHGLWMAVRTLVMLTAMSLFARAVSISELAALFARLGVKELGFVLGIALNLLPLVQETGSNTLLAMRLRGGFRRHKLRALQRLVVTLLVNCLRYGEDVVCAAESRAFSAESIHLPPLARPTAADYLSSAALLVLVGVVLLW